MPSLKKPRRRSYVVVNERVGQGNKSYRFYNSKTWRNCSTTYRYGKMCEVFPDLPAEVVDHPIPIISDKRQMPTSEGGAPLDERNWMAMSHKAHNIKRGMETHGFQVESRRIETGLIPINKQDVIDAIREKAKEGG